MVPWIDFFNYDPPRLELDTGTHALYLCGCNINKSIIRSVNGSLYS